MSLSFGEGDVILEIRANIIRRWITLAAFGGLAALLLVMAAPGANGFIYQAILTLAGIGLAFLGLRFFRATSVGLVLTSDAIKDTEGRVLCMLEQIEKVDRSAFAFKPSNGLLIVLKQKAPRAWEPGLWWRSGRKLGIGGATSAGQAKALAEAIKLIEAEQEGKLPGLGGND